MDLRYVVVEGLRIGGYAGAGNGVSSDLCRWRQGGLGKGGAWEVGLVQVHDSISPVPSKIFSDPFP